MPTRNITFAPGEFYHIYNRGTEKRTIFKDAADYRRFIELLFLCNSEKSVSIRNIKKILNNVFEFEKGEALVSIGAYCLMPNHFHILATPLVDDGLAIFMAKLGTGYTMYFNKRYERTGSLFEGTYKATHADTDEYLKYLFAYIHLNPVKLIQPDWKERGIVNREAAYQYVSTFEYSSLPDHLGHRRNEEMILEVGAFPEYFKEPKDHKTDLFEWLHFIEN